jgi:hypothetical protein
VRPCYICNKLLENYLSSLSLLTTPTPSYISIHFYLQRKTFFHSLAMISLNNVLKLHFSLLNSTLETAMIDGNLIFFLQRSMYLETSLLAQKLLHQMRMKRFEPMKRIALPAGVGTLLIVVVWVVVARQRCRQGRVVVVNLHELIPQNIPLLDAKCIAHFCRSFSKSRMVVKQANVDAYKTRRHRHIPASSDVYGQFHILLSEALKVSSKCCLSALLLDALVNFVSVSNKLRPSICWKRR